MLQRAMSGAFLEKQRADVLGSQMAYADLGEGPLTFVLLHGNPTSSNLWRGVIPHLTALGRCVAPDLIGMGDSDKLPDSGPDRYTFVEHRRYFDALLEGLELGDRVVLVIHDWGSALGFDWARRNPERVAGIAYMEAVIRPVTWEEWPEAARRAFQRLRSPEGEELILEKNYFVERILPASILRDLSEEEMDEYRGPFAEPGEGRRPTLTWPRQIPIDGEPAEVVQIVSDYGEWLATTPLPKLFVNAAPGSILVGPARDTCRAWPNQTEVTVPGVHFIQEDSADRIGEAIATWAADEVLAD
jgi:haloalkane dehalogenase